MAIVWLVALLSTACSEPIIIYGLTLSHTSVAFDAEGGQMKVEVTPFPAEESWTLGAVESEWLTVEVVEGGVQIVAAANYDSSVRTAEFTIESPEQRFDPYTVSVAQEAAPEVRFSTSAAERYTFDSEGGSRTFTVSCNVEWDVECDCEWLTVEKSTESGTVRITAEPNEASERRNANVSIVLYGAADAKNEKEIAVEQQTRAENGYLNLVGKWEITAAKWFYSPNGSLNSLDYNPNPADYYLVFDLEEGEYGKTLIMKNFLYPGTELEVRYDSESGGIVIPFGWTVLSYDVFFYLTLVSDRQFSYAAIEVGSTISEDGTSLTLDLPSVSGFNYVGFGLWTYNDNGAKVALGSQYRPTMFPMGPIVLKKQTI